MLHLMFKLTLLILVLSFSANLHAENKIKYIIHEKEEILLPKSAKLLNCKDMRKEYSIITVDLCKVNFKDD